MPVATSSASIAKCTSPTTRFTSRSTTSRRAIWAFRPWTRTLAAWARWSAGTSGTPKARAFGVPLVPADQRAHAAKVRVHGLKAQIARREVVLLEVKRVVGDVHFARSEERRGGKECRDRW